MPRAERDLLAYNPTTWRNSCSIVDNRCCGGRNCSAASGLAPLHASNLRTAPTFLVCFRGFDWDFKQNYFNSQLPSRYVGKLACAIAYDQGFGSTRRQIDSRNRLVPLSTTVLPDETFRHPLDLILLYNLA